MELEDHNHNIKFTWQCDWILIVIVGIDLSHVYSMNDPWRKSLMTMRMKCYKCGIEERGIPFRCNYCRELFCHLHRIPINHSCPFIDKYSEKKRLMMQDSYNSKSAISPSSPSSSHIDRHLISLFLRIIKIKSSKTEFLHLSKHCLLLQ
jgi:hypothetical protein